ncbi:MAG: DUF1549 domain-containing protein [Chthonomonadales bacterium]
MKRAFKTSVLALIGLLGGGGLLGSAATGQSGANWWSLQPLKMPAVPRVRNAAWVRSPMDAFILADLEKRSLQPAPPADRKTLLRRVTFDLTGLPPTPDEIRAFLQDNSPTAYEKVVDRLLASPRYGEHWGRHWLDVARFSESHGFEYDRIREHAWRYRDYVIESLNADKPYDLFLKEQIAGDLLSDSPQGKIATGFLVSGSWDQAGAGSSSPAIRGRARQEEMEEMVALVGQSALGLTVNCARCHDHKFDPIPQRDYYRMKAALDGVIPGDRSIATPSMLREQAEKREKLRTRLAVLQSEIYNIEAAAQQKLSMMPGNQRRPVTPLPLARWNFAEGGKEDRLGLDASLKGKSAFLEGGLSLKSDGSFAVSAPIKQAIREKTLEVWVSLDDRQQRGGSVITLETENGLQFDALVFGEQEPGRWMAGSESFHRTKSANGPEETSKLGEVVHVAATYAEDGTINLYRNGIPYGTAYKPTGAATELQTYPAGSTHLLFGLRHTGSTGYFKGKIYAARLYDRALKPTELLASFQAGYRFWSEANILYALTPDQITKRKACRTEIEQISAQLAVQDPQPMVYAAVPVNPPPTHILNRGEFDQEREVVSAGGIEAIKTLNADFQIPATAPDRDRRLKLAEWITHPANPLTPRVMANRIWMYHFGNGIVNTPNDFGFNGDRPSNQPLLDWLAATFIKGANGGKPWSIKSMHRMILLSNTYRQSAAFNPAAAKVDGDDRLLWRFAPRRQEGESIRDAMLSVSGEINLQMGGPSFQPFDVQNFGSNFYIQKDTGEPQFNRRSIYRINVQSAKSPFLAALDCPDPASKTPRRTMSTTAIQALELMNNTFVLRQSKKFAERVKREAGTSTNAQIDHAFEIALGRFPSAGELKRSAAFVAANDLESFCWSLLNSTEFLYVR